MATLSITKYSNKVWKFIASDVPADFSFSKLQVDTDGDSFVIVSQGGATTNSYQLADITVYASEGGTPETGWLSMEALLLRLEELNFPAWNESGAVLDFNLRVQQVGETVISNVNKLIFDGATVVNNGDDSVTITITGGGGGVTEFTELTDVPASYTGQGTKVVAVKADESGLEFVAGGGSQDLQDTLDNGATATTPTGKLIDLTHNIELISNEAYVGALSIDNQTAVYVAVSDLGDGIEPYIFFTNNNNNAILNLRISDLTDERNIQFPDKSGTIAMLDDISSGAVDSVNGQTGVVVLDSDDINEGATNLYFTDARALGAIPDATPTVKGIAKLYTSLGSNTDGAVDQNTVNTAINNILPDLVFTDTVDGFEIGTVDDTVEFKGSGTIEFGGAVELLAPAVGGTIATEEWVNESNQRIYLKPTATFPYLHTITTGATEEIVLEIPIAGSLLQNGSYLRAWTQNNFSTSAAGNKTLRYRISATSGTLGSLIGNRLTTSTSVNGLPLNRHFDFINDKLVVSQNGATSALSNISETTGSKTEVAYTYATTYYLQLTVQMPTAGESIDIYSFFVEGHK